MITLVLVFRHSVGVTRGGGGGGGRGGRDDGQRDEGGGVRGKGQEQSTPLYSSS